MSLYSIFALFVFALIVMMRKPEPLRASWPPSDLQHFSAHFLGRRRTTNQRIIREVSLDSFHTYDHHSNLRVGRQEGPSDRSNLSKRSKDYILKHGEEYLSHVKEQPSKISPTSDKSDPTGQSTLRHEPFAAVLGSALDDPSQNEPLSEMVEEEVFAEDPPDDHIGGWHLAMLIFSLMLGQLMTSFDGNVISK